ncbi:MAG: hypothetical protein AAGE52_01360 [Myxococcota bacterium]
MRYAVGLFAALGFAVSGYGEDDILGFPEMLMLVVAPAALDAWARVRAAGIERESKRELTLWQALSQCEEDPNGSE